MRNTRIEEDVLPFQGHGPPCEDGAPFISSFPVLLRTELQLFGYNEHTRDDVNE